MSEAKNPEENPGRGRLANTGRAPGNPGNSGGKKGRSGRPPNEFREAMRELTNRAKARKYLEQCIDGKFGPKFFLAALHYATDHGYGRPTQTVDLNVERFLPLLTDEQLSRLEAGEEAVAVVLEHLDELVEAARRGCAP
jgi:hypothetical protein